MEGGGNQKEPVSPEPATDDTAGTGRSYECIFCKRGFSTAQALGGHMNIHRKDRARMRHSPSTASKTDEECSEGYAYLNRHHRSFYPPVSESLKNYGMYLPGSTSGVRVVREDDVESRRPRELSLFGEDLHLGLRMRVDGRRVGGGEEKRREEEEEEEEGEVDLELRLGHEPWR